MNLTFIIYPCFFSNWVLKKYISTNEAYCREDTYFVLEWKVNIFTGCKVIPQSKNAQKSKITIYAICATQ